MTLRARWLDRGEESRRPADPAHPLGIDLVMVENPDAPTCKTSLPWPAARCGYHILECDRCGLTVAVTTAGRPDDPRSVEVNCRTVHAGSGRVQ